MLHKLKEYIKSNRKKSIIIFIIFIIFISLISLFVYKWNTDDVFQAQLNDKNAEKNYNYINDNFFKYGDDEVTEKMKEETGMDEIYGSDCPLCREGVYGYLLTKEALDEFGIDSTKEENIEKMEYLNKERTYLLNKMQELLESYTQLEEKSNTIKDDTLYKKVSIRPFNEMQFREVWYNVAGRLYHYQQNIEGEYDADKSFWVVFIEGTIFEQMEAQNKGLEIMLEHVDEFMDDSTTYEYTLEYKAVDGKWKIQNYGDYSLYKLGWMSEENNMDFDKRYEERLKLSEDIFNEYIKTTTREDCLKLDVNSEVINNIELKDYNS